MAGRKVAGISELYNAVMKGLEHICIDSDLDLSNLAIERLPDNLTVIGNLHLGGCSGITEMPNNLSVVGSLFLKGTKVKVLPASLSVGDTVYLAGTCITVVPTDISIARRLFGLEDNQRRLGMRSSRLRRGDLHR